MEAEVKLSIEYAGKSDIGPVRSENQDSFGKYPVGLMDLYEGKGQLFIVADGMGGHAGGKVASRMAVDIVNGKFFSDENPDTSEALKTAVEKANRKIFDKSSDSDYNLAGMGTTCTVLVLKENKAVIAHVGDSRVYKIEDNEIYQLTEDHTQVNEMVKEGILNRKEAKNYPLKTVLARALGTDKNVKIDIINDIQLKPGQSFVICSDGLGKVDNDEILRIVNGNPAGAACDKLIKVAVEKGGTDNVTVQIIKIQSDKKYVPLTAEITANKRKTARVLFFLIILLALIIAGILSINSFPFFNPMKDSAENQNKDRPSAETGIKIKKEKAGDIGGKPEEPRPSGKEQLITEAERLFKKGEVGNAEEIYRMILKTEPMHYGAMDGLSKIAVYYFKKAEELRNNNKLEEALGYYLKMEELQPGNSKVIDLIKLCEYQIKIKKQ